MERVGYLKHKYAALAHHNAASPAVQLLEYFDILSRQWAFTESVPQGF